MAGCQDDSDGERGKRHREASLLLDQSFWFLTDVLR